MKQLFVAVCSLLSALLWGGCSVRELPEGDGIDHNRTYRNCPATRC